MGFFDRPIAGLRPADSIIIAITAGIGVSAIYGAKIGPVSDLHATIPGDANMNSAIKKAGWESLLLVGALTLLTRDLNVVILGGGLIIAEHVMYLHADMSSPVSGKIEASPEAYQPASNAAAGEPFQIQAVS